VKTEAHYHNPPGGIRYRGAGGGAQSLAGGDAITPVLWECGGGVAGRGAGGGGANSGGRRRFSVRGPELFQGIETPPMKTVCWEASSYYAGFMTMTAYRIPLGCILQGNVILWPTSIPGSLFSRVFRRLQQRPLAASTDNNENGPWSWSRRPAPRARHAWHDGEEDVEDPACQGDEDVHDGAAALHPPRQRQREKCFGVAFAGRGLHSFTFQLNLSAGYGIGGARRGCVARVKGVFGGA